jgi:hypothetical protein
MIMIIKKSRWYISKRKSCKEGKRRERNENIPVKNVSRFLQIESAVYANETFAGSFVFHAFCAAFTFWMAVSVVNGGSGGRGDSVRSTEPEDMVLAFRERRCDVFGRTPAGTRGDRWIASLDKMRRVISRVESG